jgi:hypothetical protein
LASFVDYRRLTNILVRCSLSARLPRVLTPHLVRPRAGDARRFAGRVHTVRRAFAIRGASSLTRRPLGISCRLTAITWLQEFVELGRDKMMPYAASVLGAILPCLSHPEERVALVAQRCALRVCQRALLHVR